LPPGKLLSNFKKFRNCLLFEKKAVPNIGFMQITTLLKQASQEAFTALYDFTLPCRI
jgi:hypothetical protein